MMSGTERRPDYVYLTKSARVSENPIDVYSVICASTVSGNGVILYDDAEANSVHKMAHISNLVSVLAISNWIKPLAAKRGLYVEFETGVSECTIIFNKLGD